IVFASEAILIGADGCVSLHSLSLWVPRQSFCCPRRAPSEARLPATPGSLRRFDADSRAGSARDKTTRRSFTRKPTTQKLIRRDFTGATGLEPANSGVTGRSWRFR